MLACAVGSGQHCVLCADRAIGRRQAFYVTSTAAALVSEGLAAPAPDRRGGGGLRDRARPGVRTQ